MRAMLCLVLVLACVSSAALAEECVVSEEQRLQIDQILLALVSGEIDRKTAQEQIDALIGKGCYSVDVPSG